MLEGKMLKFEDRIAWHIKHKDNIIRGHQKDK